MTEYHDVRDIRFKGKKMVATIDGEEWSFELREISGALLNASEEERNSHEISPSGYGLHWPLLDEDLSIDGLLGIVHRPAEDEAEKPSQA